MNMMDALNAYNAMLALRPYIEKGAESLSDADASMCPSLFPVMKYDGSLIEYRKRINWEGTVMMARQDLWDLETNDPAHAPSLWVGIKYKEGIRVIPETMTAEEQFHAGELGWWEDKLYRAKYDGTVWPPSIVPDSWEVVQ